MRPSVLENAVATISGMEYLLPIACRTWLPMCACIAQFVEHCAGVSEVMGLNPVEALNFFRHLSPNCLNCWAQIEDPVIARFSLPYKIILFCQVHL